MHSAHENNSGNVFNQGENRRHNQNDYNSPERKRIRMNKPLTVRKRVQNTKPEAVKRQVRSRQKSGVDPPVRLVFGRKPSVDKLKRPAERAADKKKKCKYKNAAHCLSPFSFFVYCITEVTINQQKFVRPPQYRTQKKLDNPSAAEFNV